MSVGAYGSPETPSRKVRLLSLDGGGIRGISIIIILKEIMRQVNQGRSKNERLEPWQVFDLIGGTSTGGIIAIMLGRLRMTLDECEEAYKRLAKEIFQPKRSRLNPLRMIEFYQASERFDSHAMEKLVKGIISSRTGSENTPLKQNTPKGHSCKVFVTTVRADDQELCLLRSYSNSRQPDYELLNWEVWEALRATSAANTYFDAHLKGGSRYVDGAIKSNNPVYSVMAEANDLWNISETLMISIGTGEKDPKPIGGSVLDLARTLTKTLVSATDTEKNFRRSHRKMAEEGLLYRFNVPRLGHVKLHDYAAIPAVVHSTQQFLNDGLIEREVTRCANTIKDHSVEKPVGDAASTGNRPGAPRFTQEESDCLRSLHATAGDYESHRTSIDKPVPGTCEWLLSNKKFTEWLEDKSSPLIWLTANPGCGKSVMSGFLIDHLQKVVPEATVCYFFFKNGESNRDEAHQALCALLHQTITNFPKGAKAVVEAFSNQDQRLMNSNLERLWKLFQGNLKEANSNNVVFVVDALDECSEASRNRFINLLSTSFSQSQPSEQASASVKILATSRPWPSIERSFKQQNIIRLRGEGEAQISADIERMVKYKVQKLLDEESISPEAQSFIEDKLLSGADQTFLWVSLVLEKLNQLQSRTIKNIRRTFEDIPTQLDKLYEQAVSLFQDKETSLRLLRLVVAARVPLHLEEINIIMNIDQDTKSLDALRQDLEPNMEYAAKLLGGFFIRVVDSRVHLVHQTARDFLVRAQGNLLPEVALAAADLRLGKQDLIEACISYLVLKDIPKQKAHPAENENLDALNDQLLQRLPAWGRRFYSFAANNWGIIPGATTFIEENERVKQKALLLCSTNKDFFMGWWCFYVANRPLIWPSQYQEYERLDKYFAHVTTHKGHLTITKLLLETKSCNYTDEDFDGEDLLNAAAARQSEHVIWLLKNFSHEDMQCGRALLRALSRNSRAAVCALVKTGVDLNTEYKEEGEADSPGRRAVPRSDCLQLLLDNGLVVADDQILIAASGGYVESLGILITHDTRSEDERREAMNKAIQKAAHEGTIDCYDLILRKVPDLITSKPDVCIGLEQAILRWDTSDIFELLDRGADISKALEMLCTIGDVGCAKRLLTGREYSKTSLDKGLSLFFEVTMGNDLEAYVEKMTRKTLSSPKDPTRLYNAFKQRPSFCESQTAEFVRLFLGKGARVSHEQFIRAVSVVIPFDNKLAHFLLANMDGVQGGILKPQDFLPIACLWGKEDVVQAIIAQEEVDVRVKDNIGMTPIIAAVISGNPLVVSILLDNGARPDEIVTCSFSSLEKSCASSLTKLQSVFIEHNGGHFAESAFELSQRLGYTDITKLLNTA